MNNPMYSGQCAVGKFKRHECIGRERTLQIAGLLGGEAETRIIRFMPEHDNDTFTTFTKLSQPTTNQPAANLTALMVRQNSHGGQGNGRYRSLRRLYQYPAKQNVPDDLALNLRDK